MIEHCDCFDFPVSWWFYRSHCIEFHGFDPGDNEVPEDIGVATPIEQPEWTKKQWDTVNQLRAMVLHLQSKINELRLSKKKGTIYK